MEEKEFWVTTYEQWNVNVSYRVQAGSREEAKRKIFDGEVEYYHFEVLPGFEHTEVIEVKEVAEGD